MIDPKFQQFIKDVKSRVPLTYKKLLKQAQGLVDGKDIDAILKKIELSGSYSLKSKKRPTENSDIDLLVTYEGSAEPEQLVNALAGKLYGEFGAYDVQVVKEKYTEKFYTMARAGSLLISIYINPTLSELKKYCPIGARAFVTAAGDVYVEGYEEEKENRLSSIMHGPIIEMIRDKDPSLFPPDVSSELIWGNRHYGITMQRYQDTNEFYIGESQDGYSSLMLDRAQQKNPQLVLSGESIKEKKNYNDMSNWGSLKDIEDITSMTESLPYQFIQEVFQEDGEGGGVAPAASVSANPANLSTGSSSTLSKQAPEHMRFSVVTPFGNVSRKKKKTKKKGWPYN